MRRLHDTGRSGWWQLLQLTGLGSFVLLFWQLQRGASGANQFGVDPLLAVAGGPPSQGFNGPQPTGGPGAPAGYPGGPPKKSKTGLIIGLVVLGVVIVAGLASIANKGGSGGADKTGAPAPIALNQPASVGGVEITVTSVSQVQRVGGQWVNAEAAPDGVLVVVNYTVKNTSDKPVSASDMPDLTLRDANGTVYKPDTGKTAAYATEANLTAKALSDLNPGLSITDAEVFEVSSKSFDPSKWAVMVGDTAFALQKPAVPSKPAPPQAAALASTTAASSSSTTTTADQSGSSPEATAPAKSADPVEARYTPAYKQCMGGGDAAEGITSAMVDCTDAELKIQDAKLNDTYKQVMAQLSPDQQSRLRDRQRAWLRYEHTECTADATGGTMDEINQSSCTLKETVKRTMVLEQPVAQLLQ